MDAPTADATTNGPGHARSTVQAVVLHGVDDLRIEEVPLQRPAEGQVQVAIKAIGICGSDVHYWKHGRIGQFVVKEPMIIGHECAGQVVAVGPGVKGLQPGDRVALEPGEPCWCSHWTREGRYNLDPDIKFFATPPFHGAMAERVNHPAALCFRLPDNVSYEAGAMVEPLSVGLHACRRAQVQPGVKVLVLGAGPIGLVTVLSAKAFGADDVCIVNTNAQRLAMAVQLGASCSIMWEQDESVEAMASRVREALQDPEGPQVVIDCAGYESTMQLAVAACRPGGRIVLVGMGQEEVKVNMATITTHELDVLGSFRYLNTYPLALSLLSNGRIDVNPLITHRFGLQQALEGFDTAFRAKETGAIKVMFAVNDDEEKATMAQS